MNGTLAEIARYRTQNNSPWMEIINLALEVAPERAKPILRKIAKNDRQISELLMRLADE